MNQEQIDSTIKVLKEKGYNVELVKQPSDDDMIKSLQDAGYVVTKEKNIAETKTDTETEPNLNDIMKQYGFEPIKDKGNETQSNETTTTKQETKQGEEKETEPSKENDTKRNVMFLLGTPTETNEDNGVINEDTIKVMTPEQIQENMPDIKEYILANGGSF